MAQNAASSPGEGNAPEPVLFDRPEITLPDPVPDHPLLNGRREIGRGEYSAVFEADDPEHVLKLISSPADYFLLTAEDRPRGIHFPIVYADLGVVGRAQSGFPFHLIEMEKLYPLVDHSPAADLAHRLTAFYWQACQKWSQLGMSMGRIAFYHMLKEPLSIDNTMHEALTALSDFIEEYQVLPDILSVDNLMMRKDGTLVFCDPVFIA